MELRYWRIKVVTVVILSFMTVKAKADACSINEDKCGNVVLDDSEAKRDSVPKIICVMPPVDANGNTIPMDSMNRITCVMPPVDADDGAEVQDTIEGVSGFTKKMADFQLKMMQRVADSQRPKSSNGGFKVIFMPPPLGSMPEYGFGLGLGGCGIFKTGRQPTLYTSSIPVNVRFGFTNPFSFRITSTPVLYFRNNRLKIGAEIYYQQRYEHYFGIGYETNKNISRDRYVTGYQSRRWHVSPKVEWKVGASDFYMGIIADFSYDKMRNPGSCLLENYEYDRAGGTIDGLTLMDVGAGLDLSLDTRDVAYSPYNGVYINLRSIYYSKAVGSDHSYGKITFDYRHYKQIGGKRCVLAWGLSSSNVIGNDIPFARYATIGDIYATRGYYGYQYRDKSVLKAHVEYRYMFNFKGIVARMLINRFGVAGWTGMAVMGENIVKYNAVLPELGAGVRMQISPRVNMRFDLGYDINEKRMLKYFGISETF